MPDAPIGHVVRNVRQKIGMTQTALAEAMGVSVSYINLIEHDRRRLNDQRLRDISRILGIDSSALDGEAERQLLAALDEVTSNPAVSDLALDRAKARSLVAEHEPWARALVALHRSGQRDQGLIAAFTDRLNHDPLLNDSIHEMLNASTAIRSVTAIYDDGGDIPPAQRKRFDAMLTAESARLADVARSLASFFERSETPGTALTAAEEVDDFLFEHRNYFPDIEAAMDQVRDSISVSKMPSNRELVDTFERLGLSLRRVSLDTLPSGAHRLSHFDGRVLSIAIGLPHWTERFEIARRIAEHTARDAIESEIKAATDLTSDEARARANRALYAYGAASLVMPYETFYETAERLRYDIDALSMNFEASPEQLCHRFTSLRKPGSEGVPFAFLRANAAGYLTKRFPLPRLPIPRFGGACPLWAVYAAMQTPDMRHRQLAEFPNGDRFFIIARATRPIASSFGQSLPSYSLMLACDALNADRLVYSDGIDLSSAAQAEPVGPTCLLCPRAGCAHRQEPSVRTNEGV